MTAQYEDLVKMLIDGTDPMNMPIWQKIVVLIVISTCTCWDFFCLGHWTLVD
jgi:hypothetical protein